MTLWSESDVLQELDCRKRRGSPKGFSRRVTAQPLANHGNVFCPRNLTLS